MRNRLILVILLLPVILFASEPREKGYMGIYREIVDELPLVEDAPTAMCGVKILDVRLDSPAYRCGLRRGDIIVRMDDLDFGVSKDELEDRFKEYFDRSSPGDRIRVTVLRRIVRRNLIVNGEEHEASTYLKAPDTFLDELPEKADLTLTVHKEWVVRNFEITLGHRNEGKYPGPPEIDETGLAGIFTRSCWSSLVDEVVDRYDIREEYGDLRKRLRKLHSTDDGSRLQIVSSVHRDPFLAESIARTITDRFLENPLSLQDVALFMTATVQSWEPPEFPRLDLETDEDGFRDWFSTCVTPLLNRLNKLYAVFTDEEKEFLMEHRFALTDFFAENIYIHSDDDPVRLEQNKRVIELGRNLDFAGLCKTADDTLHFLSVTTASVFEWMKKHPGIRSIETDNGKIGFGSGEHDWWKESDFKFIYDPGGDDLYSDGTATADSFDRPLSWIIDLDGEDAYQSTAPNGSQGSGLPGVGILMDEKGNDTYIGQRFSQGTGYMGIGILHDGEGNDVYHGTEFVQGSGLFGLGALIDNQGDDRYYGTIHAQACGFTGGMGILLDRQGNDTGYSTGKHPTNYGTPGIFDAWSQGCGMGFRGIASGGIGLLIDGNGNDDWEAGNFSQGGGYYYGIGIFRAAGYGNDKYTGSRYAQGFCAHQAIGVFMEDGGDDRYHTRHGVNAGLAWDESVTVFLDQGGNDIYNGGTFFSLGASAHNSITLWRDSGGNDAYQFSAGPARAGSNKYHGGHSLSLFIDVGDAPDYYSSEKVKNDIELAWPDFGIFRDGKAELKSPLKKPEPEN